MHVIITPTFYLPFQDSCLLCTPQCHTHTSKIFRVAYNGHAKLPTVQQNIFYTTTGVLCYPFWLKAVFLFDNFLHAPALLLVVYELGPLVSSPSITFQNNHL